MVTRTKTGKQLIHQAPNIEITGLNKFCLNLRYVCDDACLDAL